MPLSVASKLGVQFARFVAASGNAANNAHHGFRGAFNNASSVFGNSTAGSSTSTAGASSSWASGLSSSGPSASSSGSTGLGGAKFHAGRGAHSTFQQSGRILTNPHGSSAHDGTSTVADDDEDASLKAARVHRASKLHRSSLLSVQHRSTLSSFAARQRLIESSAIPALQLISPTFIPRSTSQHAALHTSAATTQDVQRSDAVAEKSDAAVEASMALEGNVESRHADPPLPKRPLHRKTKSLSAAEERPEVVEAADFASAVSLMSAGNVMPRSRRTEEKPRYDGDSQEISGQLFRASKNRSPLAVQLAVKKLQDLPKSSLSTALYNTALDALVATRPPYSDIAPITSLYVEMINSSCLPNVRTLTIMASVLCDRDHETFIDRHNRKRQSDAVLPEEQDYYSQALSILNVAHTSYFGFVTIDAYNSILRSCMLRGDAERACDVLNILSGKDNIKPNADTFANLLECLANDSATKTAAAVGQTSETDTSRMLGACQTIFDEFEVLRASEGWKASKRDTAVWNIMLRSHLELNDAAGAVKLIELMLSGTPRAKGNTTPPKPESETTASLLLGFAGIGDFESAQVWLSRICSSHESPLSETEPSLPMPRLIRLEALTSAFLRHIKDLEIGKASVDELQARVPSIRAVNQLMALRHDACLQGTDRGVKRSQVSEVLCINAASAKVYTAHQLPQQADEFLDEGLKIVDAHFRAFGEFILEQRPPEDPRTFAVGIKNILSSRASGYLSLTRQLVDADRLEDAASLLTYVPSLFMEVNLKDMINLHPQYDEIFKDAREAVIQVGLKLLNTRQMTKLAELVVIFAETAQLPLTKLGCMPMRMSVDFLQLYLMAREEVSVEDLPLSATGWTFVCDQIAQVKAITHQPIPWRELHEDFAKLSEELRSGIDSTQIRNALLTDASVPQDLAQAFQRLWSASNTAETMSAPSEMTDSLLSSAQSPTSTLGSTVPTPPTFTSSKVADNLISTVQAPLARTISAALRPIQVIDEDFGQTLIQQVAPHQSREQDMHSAMQRVRGAIDADGTYPSPDAIAAILDATCRTPGRDIGKIRELKAMGDVIVEALGGDPKWQTTAWLQMEDTYMRALAHAGDAKGASEQRHKIIAAGEIPTADSYAALINVVRNTTDDALVAEELYEESQRLNVQPTKYLMNTVISKLCRARKLDKAMQIFHSMPNANVRPSSVTFGALINGATRIDDEATAETLFAAMEQVLEKRFASAPPFNTMMQYYTYTRKDRNKANQYYHRMRHIGVRPTEHTYKILLDMHTTGGIVDIEGIERTFGELIASQNVQIQSNHWASLIQAHGRNAMNLDKAVHIFETLLDHPTSRRKKSQIMRDAVIYEALFDVLLAHNRLDMMQHYVQHMREARVTPTAYVANILLKGLAPHDIQQARALFAEMEDPPTGMAATGNHPVNHRHHADTSDAVLSAPQPPAMPQMPSNFGFAGVLREPSTFQTMIALEMQYGDWSAASWLLSQMEQRGYPPPLISNARGLIIEAMYAQAPPANVAQTAMPTEAYASMPNTQQETIHA